MSRASPSVCFSSRSSHSLVFRSSDSRTVLAAFWNFRVVDGVVDANGAAELRDVLVLGTVVRMLITVGCSCRVDVRRFPYAIDTVELAFSAVEETDVDFLITVGFFYRGYVLFLGVDEWVEPVCVVVDQF